jgi:TetR/AcrR family transcriptional repressor of nem operon
VNAKTAQKERSHSGILASASRLVRQRGIAGARVVDVMAGAGLTVGGFYAHFASKEALLEETLASCSNLMRERLFAKLDEKPAPDRALVALKRYLSARHRDDLEAGCPLPAVVGEIGTTAHEYREAVADHVDEFAGALAAHVHGAPLPARTMALGLIALMVGGLSLARATRGTPLSDEIIAACRAFGARSLKEMHR